MGTSGEASADVVRQTFSVDKRARQSLNGHPSMVVWFTGLPGAGKSTLANELEQHLHRRGLLTYLLDGDNVRLGLNKGLGFSAEDRTENVRRVAEVARMMVDAGLVVIVALVSPFAAERRMARQLVGFGEFIEVFVDAPPDVVQRRDPKGLYRRARQGEIQGLTGVDAPYEAPATPEVHLNTATLGVPECVDRLLAVLDRQGLFGGIQR